MNRSKIFYHWQLENGQLSLDAPDRGACIYINNDSYLCAARGTLTLPEFIGMIYKFLNVYSKMI